MNTYIFKVGNNVYHVEAENKLKAMAIANRDFIWGVVEGFYAWADAGQADTFYATFGGWD